MIPVLPSTRCFNDCVRNAECDEHLIKVMFEIQNEYDIKKLSLDEIIKIVREKEQH